MSDPLQEMDDELGLASVHVGFPVERDELARRLLRDGISTEDVRMIADHCRATVVGLGAAARVLAALLIDAPLRDARLVDLKKIADLRGKRDRQEARPFGDAPYVPGPAPGEPAEVWDHDRQCRMAKCRHDGDRVPMHVLARDLGVSETTAEAMVARGRVLDSNGNAKPKKPDSPAKAEKTEKATEKRITDFRERMSIDRKQRERAGGRKPIDWARLQKEQGNILARLRSTGSIDLAEIVKDKVKLGALAELESAGHILRAGVPDAVQRQPYLVARDDAEREHFKQCRRGWDQADMNKPRRKVAAD